MKPIPGTSYQARSFDTAKTQVSSVQGAALTQESALQSRTAEEQIKCYEMPFGSGSDRLGCVSDPSLS